MQKMVDLAPNLCWAPYVNGATGVADLANILAAVAFDGDKT